jgi:putative ABC transport system permease protein
MEAEILISAADMNTLADGGPLPRQRMFEALGAEGVLRATPVYYGRIDWRQPNGAQRAMDVFGVDTSAQAFRSAAINARLPELATGDFALIDRRTRNLDKALAAMIAAGETFRFEAKGRTLTVIGSFEIGGGFAADGYLVVSDQTFLRLFPQRAAGAPNQILVKTTEGSDPRVVAQRLRGILPAYDSIVRPMDEAVAREQAFQLTQRPIGIIFGFGVFIGVLVGIIIVYQVLSTDVADHLREYATFKAIGYRQGFFLGIVFEEAIVLAVLGFIPGLIGSIGLYAAVGAATELPLTMTPGRAFGVLAATIVMCTISGAVATRRLARANPADLF